MASCRLFQSPAIDELQEAMEIETSRVGPSDNPDSPGRQGVVVDLHAERATRPARR